MLNSIFLRFRHAYKEGKKEKPFSFSEESETSSKPIIPEDLLCTICQDILTDAVMMPCCGNSFCDECKLNCFFYDCMKYSPYFMSHLKCRKFYFCNAFARLVLTLEDCFLCQIISIFTCW